MVSITMSRLSTNDRVSSTKGMFLSSKRRT